MKNFIELIIGTAIMFGFWGFMYPEFCLTQDMYEYQENGIDIEKDSLTDFYQMLNTDEIIVKSKMIEYFSRIS
ncbi:MAG: hypothetical protein R3Y24_10355 [Eubacteriales bacterium]